LARTVYSGPDRRTARIAVLFTFDLIEHDWEHGLVEDAGR
jgi:hypothetical protein